MPASSSAIRAGRAFVELFADDSQMVRTLKRAQAKLNAFSASVTAIGTKMLAAGAAIASPFAVAVKAASDAEEVASKFGVVFGDNADAVRAWGDEFASQVGRGKTEIARFLAGSQDLFVPLGFDPREAEELSKQITKLTVDLGSFNNMADADVMRDLQAALTGSGEVMKKYGVLVSEAAVKQELLNQSIDPKTASDQQKVLARMTIIIRGTTAAHGDAIRTAGGFANQMKALTAALTDTAEVVGKALLPFVTPIVGLFKQGAVAAGEFAQENAGIFVAIAAGAATLAAAGAGMIALGVAAKVAAVGFGVASAAVTTFGAILGAILSPIGLITAAVVGGVGAWLVYSDAGQKALGAIADRFAAFKVDAMKAFQGVADALAAGDIQLAGEVAIAGLRVAWEHGLAFLRTAWAKFADTFLEVWINVSTSFRKAWADAVAGATIIAAEAGTAIKGFFENAASAALEAVGAITAEEAAQAREDLARNRARELTAEVEAALAENSAALEELENARKAAQESRARGTAEEIKAAEASLEAARAKLQEATDRAANARRDAESEAAGAAAVPQAINVEVPDLDAVSDKLAVAADKMIAAQDQLPNLLALGSQEAAQALLRHEFSQENRDAERLQRELNKLNKDQLRELRNVVRKISNPVQLAAANLV